MAGGPVYGNARPMAVPPSLVAVVGASGGLGASTLSLAVGRRLSATGPPAVVADLDLGRGGLEVSAGVEHLPGRRWDDLRGVRGRVPPDLLLSSLPGEAGCSVLSARGGGAPPVPDSAVLDVLDSLAQTRARVVLDLPLTSPLLPVVLAPGALVLVVLGLRARALADAEACVERLVAAATDGGGVLADRGGDEVPVVDPGGGPFRMRLVTRGGRARAEVLDDVVAHLGVAHLHHLPDDPHVTRDAERGLFPGVGRDAMRRCADRIVAEVDALDEAS
jgi:hypothetical protein